MDTFSISFPLAVLCPTEAFFPSVDRVTDALADLEDCSPELLDSAVSADQSTQAVQFEVTVTANTAGEALDQAVGLVRTAIHAAGQCPLYRSPTG